MGLFAGFLHFFSYVSFDAKVFRRLGRCFTPAFPVFHPACPTMPSCARSHVGSRSSKEIPSTKTSRRSWNTSRPAQVIFFRWSVGFVGFFLVSEVLLMWWDVWERDTCF